MDQVTQEVKPLKVNYSFWAKKISNMQATLVVMAQDLEHLTQVLNQLGELPPAAVEALMQMAASMQGARVPGPRTKDGLQSRVSELVEVFLTRLEEHGAKGFNSRQCADFVVENLTLVERARFKSAMTYEGLQKFVGLEKIEKLSAGQGKTPATYRFKTATVEQALAGGV